MTNTRDRTPQDSTPDEMRPAILAAMLNHVPFDGWGETAVKATAEELGISRNFIALAFPGGVLEMIEAFSRQADEALAAELTPERLAPLKVRERIALAVRRRIEGNARHREAARRAFTLLALPQNAATGSRLAWATADSIWRAIGDISTDYNYYTKRGILAGVFTATLLYWLNDESEDSVETWDFLDRRIANVVDFEKAKAEFSRFGDFGKSLVRGLGRLRYGA